MDDRAAIERLIYEYTYRLDRADFDAWGELFADADWAIAAGFESDQGIVLHGAEAVAEWGRANLKVHEDGTLKTKHVTTNVTIEIDPEGDGASARMYLTVFQAVPPHFPLQAVFSGRYEDEFVKEDGQWRFDRRLIHADAVGDLSEHNTQV